MFIIAGVDGTSSRDWFSANRSYSHVNSFIKDINTLDIYKKFWHGPNLSGTDSKKIKDEVYAWVKGLLLKSNNMHTTEVVLVGHSRGAAIVMDVARELQSDIKKEVLFMGLYDSVDRTWQLGNTTKETKGTPTIVNTSYCYHAMRDPNMYSRVSFGNSGNESSNPKGFKKKFFYTSHGGIGGAPGLENLPWYTYGAYGSDHSATPTFMNNKLTSLSGSDVRKLYIYESINADNWIREGARSAGVSLHASHRSQILNDILSDIIESETKSSRATTRRVNNRIVGRKYGEPPF